MWGRHNHFYQRTHLFKFLQEVPAVRVLRYETLRNDLDSLLRLHGLEPLKADEFKRDPGFVTPGKPETHWLDYYSEDEIQAVYEMFKAELMQLGYDHEGTFRRGVSSPDGRALHVFPDWQGDRPLLERLRERGM